MNCYTPDRLQLLNAIHSSNRCTAFGNISMDAFPFNAGDLCEYLECLSDADLLDYKRFYGGNERTSVALVAFHGLFCRHRELTTLADDNGVYALHWAAFHYGIVDLEQKEIALLLFQAIYTFNPDALWKRTTAFVCQYQWEWNFFVDGWTPLDILCLNKAHGDIIDNLMQRSKEPKGKTTTRKAAASSLVAAILSEDIELVASVAKSYPGDITKPVNLRYTKNGKIQCQSPLEFTFRLPENLFALEAFKVLMKAYELAGTPSSFSMNTFEQWATATDKKGALLPCWKECLSITCNNWTESGLKTYLSRLEESVSSVKVLELRVPDSLLDNEVIELGVSQVLRRLPPKINFHLRFGKHE